jgi:hypothetical protein
MAARHVAFMQARIPGRGSLEDYLRRAAILDGDVRGGGMALVFATEMMR